jgi:hypothetical protein
VGPEQELEIDLATSAPVYPAALRSLALRSAAALFASPVQDHLDVPVAPEPIPQILVEAGLVVGDEKEMSGHALLHYPPAGCGGSTFSAVNGSEHLRCQLRRS